MVVVVAVAVAVAVVPVVVVIANELSSPFAHLTSSSDWQAEQVLLSQSIPCSSKVGKHVINRKKSLIWEEIAQNHRKMRGKAKSVNLNIFHSRSS